MNDYVNKLLNAPWVHYSSVNSTNNVLMSLSNSDIIDGMTCTADTQTGGFGRRQRDWLSPPGGLYMSILLVPTVKPMVWQTIGFVMGVAAARALSDLCLDINPQLKWPNDILVDNCKAGGILVQSKTGDIPRVVAGLGINVSTNPRLLPHNAIFPACTIQQNSDHHVAITDLARLIRTIFFRLYDKWLRNPEIIINSWNKLSALKGKTLKLKINDKEVKGICEGINSSGHLLLKNSGVTRNIHCGDVVSITSFES
jgi:BirA family transcriptional regulator, biotin operon repressor / biotin---[acetyl-CoA-carboxylase] ligase